MLSVVSRPGLTHLDGNVEAMRVLRVARFSARKARTQALNQMRSLISTPPDEIRAELRSLNVYRLLECASSCRPGDRDDVHVVTKFTLPDFAGQTWRIRRR